MGPKHWGSLVGALGFLHLSLNVSIYTYYVRTPVSSEEQDQDLGFLTLSAYQGIQVSKYIL